MVANVILGILAGLSVVLLLWQWAVAARFPLHQRSAAHAFPPAVTLLKPLKGADASTEDCLRSWLRQDYTGRVQVLFGVASEEDPVCGIVRRLLTEFPDSDAQLVICGPLLGANAKVSKLAELEGKARHEIVVVSDADVRVPPDFLANLVEPLRQPEVGLVNCFYRLANPSTLAMHYEALAVNADFWSQVLQGRSLKPLDFALGAVMATRRKQLEQMGGFRALVDCLADDYQLGNRIARLGHGIALCPVVVECWEKPMGWVAVWKHQLRWARTIRVCQPAPYFFSVLSNPTLWPLLWVAVRPGPWSIGCVAVALIARVGAVFDLQRRLNRSRSHGRFFWLTPLKDLLQAALWLAAFSGNRVEWRGERLRLRSDGTLVRS
ncbi:MAG TPA: bacteriohopanetetrol glucosamine biosynthesis glycosyltransferase HpnI [Methylomirabilota bacterium]|nr:bacteriohopanetetrol glucosamine biosynthesis glycosyltransferase HpnI [Methylomirabilota bacterium]